MFVGRELTRLHSYGGDDENIELIICQRSSLTAAYGKEDALFYILEDVFQRSETFIRQFFF